jgi:hypothetical protein
MKIRSLLLSVVPAVLAATACSTSAEESMQSAGALLPRRAESDASGVDVRYRGGPVLSHVNVHTVYWGDAVPDRDNLNRFYGDVVASPYFDWLGEYDTPNQSIGRGSFAGELVDANPPAGGRVTDQMVQDELARLIDDGSLPAPGADDLFMMHFPPSVTVTMKAWWSNGQTLATCAQLCGYHGTFVHNGANVYYAVLPDVGGPCAHGCGIGTKLESQTSIASHELVEAVTDPAISLATGVQAPLAWWDSTNWEIGDICQFNTETLGSWKVQRQYSMKWGQCIATEPSITTLANGVPVRGINADDSPHAPQFRIDVPTGARNLVIAMRRGPNPYLQANLYLHYGSAASFGRHDCMAGGSNGTDGQWQCVVSAPQPGTYYALIQAWQTVSVEAAEIEASYEAP